MSPRRSPRRRSYTPEQANAALPLVRVIVRDLVGLSREVTERRQRLALLLDRRQPESNSPYREELAQIQDELKKDMRRLQGYVEELRELGVEPKSVTEGLVDFPTRMDGRKAYLCWKLGEPEVLYWHDLDAGFQGRQPLLAAGGIAEDGSAGSGEGSLDQ
jgi:hypothetical protein